MPSVSSLAAAADDERTLYRLAFGDGKPAGFGLVRHAVDAAGLVVARRDLLAARAGELERSYRAAVLVGLEASTWHAMRSRRHIPGPFQPLEPGRSSESTCSACGLAAVADAKPAPNGIEIGGPAVALDCATAHARPGGPVPSGVLAKLAERDAQIAAVAKSFRCRVAAYVGVDKARAIDAMNRIERDPHVCHSHDFTDSNVHMADAMADVLKRDAWLPSDVDEGACTERQAEADNRLWDAAWRIAKRDGFSAADVVLASPPCDRPIHRRD